MSDPYNHHGRNAGEPTIIFRNTDRFHLRTEDKTKAKIDMDGLTFMVRRRFNWLQRTMIRIVFGWTVTNVEKP